MPVSNARILDLVFRGHSPAEIANLLSIDANAVRTVVQDVTQAPAGATAPASGDQRAVDLVFAGHGIAEVANMVGVSESHVRDVLSAGVVQPTVGGNPLVPAAQELAYAEITANPGTANASSGADVPGLAVTFIAPNKPVVLEAWCYSIGQTAAGLPILFIQDSGSNTVSQASGGAVAAGGFSPAIIVRKRYAAGVLTPGQSYTFKVHYAAGTSGTAQLYAGTAFPAFLRAFTG